MIRDRPFVDISVTSAALPVTQLSQLHQISKWRMTSVNISMVQLTCSVIYLQVFEFNRVITSFRSDRISSIDFYKFMSQYL